MKEKSGIGIKFGKLADSEFDRILELIISSEGKVLNTILGLRLEDYSLSPSQFKKLVNWVFDGKDHSVVSERLNIINSYFKARDVGTISLRNFKIYFETLSNYYKEKELVMTKTDTEQFIIDPGLWISTKKLADIVNTYLDKINVTADGIKVILNSIMLNTSIGGSYYWLNKVYFKYRNYNNAYLFNNYIDNLVQSVNSNRLLNLENLENYKLDDALENNWEDTYGR